MQAMMLLALAVLIWSITGPLAEIVQWDPFSHAGIRHGVSFLVTLALGRRLRRLPTWLEVLGGLGVAGTTLGYVTATKLSCAPYAMVLLYLAPVFAAVLRRMFFGHSLHWTYWPAVSVVVLGLVLMTSDQKNAATFPAVAAGLAGALCYATWSVCREAEKEAKEDASLLLGFAMGLVLFSLFPKEWLGLRHVVTSDTTSIIGVVIGGALAGMAYWAMSRATESFPGPTVLLIGSAEAPLATLWVWLFLGREFGLLALLGALLSLAATILYGLHVMRIEQKD